MILIVVPCFNEAQRFKAEYFDQLVVIQNTFWLFVDDGSKDETANLLEKFSKYPNTKALRILTNVGKSEAIRYGFLKGLDIQSDLSWIGFLDSDGAFSIDDIKLIISKAQGTTMHGKSAIFSSRVKLAGRKIDRKFVRHLYGRLIATWFGIIWKSIPYDTQSGFKIFRNTIDFRTAIQVVFQTRWFCDIEISARLAKLQNGSFRIWEEPLYSWLDIGGSKISFREIFRLLIEIPKITWILTCNRNYLS
jgi:glycosyltransferase involved in cell wall biosynthesis